MSGPSSARPERGSRSRSARGRLDRVIDRRWATVLAALGFVIAVAVLVLAATQVIPWIWVSVVTVLCGIVAGVRWWRDRQSRLLAETAAADRADGSFPGREPRRDGTGEAAQQSTTHDLTG